MLDDHLTDRAIACDNVEDTRRNPGFAAEIGKKQRCERGVFGGLQDNRVPHGERGCDLPREHQKREVPGDDLAGHAKRLAVRQFVVHQLGHASVVIEMACDERDVYVAAFADGFAVVEGLEHCKEPGLLLDQAGQRIEHTSATFWVFSP